MSSSKKDGSSSKKHRSSSRKERACAEDIRLATITGLEVAGLHSADAVRAKIAEVTASFPSLYERELVTVTPSGTASSSSSAKLFQGEGESMEGDKVFSVKQFNVLAEGLSAPPGAYPPFPADTRGHDLQPSSYGGFDRVHDADQVFNFHRYRKWRLIEEIIREGTEPDILTLQECDHFYDFFLPILQLFGYEGIFCSKALSPSCQFGYYSDGVALFWKSALFTQIPLELEYEGDRPYPVYLAQCLRHHTTQQLLCVATCHLKAKGGADMESLRLQQITSVLGVIQQLSAVASEIAETEAAAAATEEALAGGKQSQTAPKVGPPAILLMGDFNTDPPEHKPKDKGLTISYVQKWQNGTLHSAYPLFGPIFSSAPSFTTYPGTDKAYSTWKWRGDYEKRDLIDYIWVSHSTIDVLALLAPPPYEEMANSVGKLPDIRYPSDHLSLFAVLRFSGGK